jgi:hypothetical protein
MRITTCPTATIHAPREIIWHLLTDPSSYDVWTRAHFAGATPAGYAQPGQRLDFVVRRYGLRFRVRFDVRDVDEPSGRMRLDVHLPFDVINHETIKVSTLGEAGTFVSFN